MTVIYYVETNLICMTVLLLFTQQMHFRRDSLSANNRTFRLILWSTIAMCASDMIAGICRGKFFWGARAIIEVSNLLYFEALSVISFLWLIYVLLKLKRITRYHKKIVFWALPLVAITIVTLVNPVTHILFVIDEQNLYVRNVGVYLHWLVTWFYLLTATGFTVSQIIRERNRKQRRLIMPLLYFIIAPVIAAVIQMLFYGVSCSQVGITISVVMISLTVQNNQIFTDALTGLNNRYSFSKYVENSILRRVKTNLSFTLLDINNFKQVNDKFGHLEGDRALADAADAIQKSCEETTDKLYVCRYGGDEFLIVGIDCTADDIQHLKTQIRRKLEEKNNSNQYPYVLSVSMGTANGVCVDFDDVERLLRTADELMYEEKSRTKNTVLL